MRTVPRVTIVRVGTDPFGRGERTVFYRDAAIGDGTEVFYLWARHWVRDHPDMPIPPDGYDTEPPLPPSRGPCVPYVLEPGRPERLSSLITVVTRKKK